LWIILASRSNALPKKKGPNGPKIFLRGEEVLEQRLQRGLIQQQLGERVGLSDAWISRIERNATRGVSAATADNFAAFFGIPLEKLVMCGPIESVQGEATAARQTIRLGEIRELVRARARAVQDATNDLLSVTLEVLAGDNVESRRLLPIPAGHGDFSGSGDVLGRLRAVLEERRADLEKMRWQRGGESGHSHIDDKNGIWLNAWSPMGDKFETAEQLIQMAREAQRDNRYGEAQEIASQVLEQFKTPPSGGMATQAWDCLRADATLQVVSNLYHQGSISRAISAAAAGLKQTSGSPDLLPRRVAFLIWLGELRALYGEAFEARERIDAARELLHASAWPPEAPRSLLKANLLHVEGIVEERLGHCDQALVAYERSVEEIKRGHREGNGVAREDVTALEAYVERDRCRLRIRQGNLLLAIDHCERSYELRKGLGHGLRATAHFYAYIADIFRSVSDDVDEQLREALFTAIEGFEDIGDDLDVARTQLRIARLYRKDGRPRDARYWARLALTFGDHGDLPFFQALAYRQLGKAMLEESHSVNVASDYRRSLYRQAEDYLRLSVSLLELLQDRFELALSRRALGVALTDRVGSGGNDTCAAQAHDALVAAQEAFGLFGNIPEQEKTRIALAALDAVTRSGSRLVGQHSKTDAEVA